MTKNDASTPPERSQEDRDETPPHPLQHLISYPLHELPRNVGMKHIIAMCQKILGSNWRIREAAVKVGNSTGHNERPIVGGRSAYESLSAILEWRQTTDERTANDYRKRANGMAKKMGFDLNRPKDAIEFAKRFHDRVADLSPSSVRQYRSAVAYRFSDYIVAQTDRKKLETSLVLFLVVDAEAVPVQSVPSSHEGPTGFSSSGRGKASTRRTGPSILRYLPHDDREALRLELFKSRSKRGQIVNAVLDTIELVGPRPIECRTLKPVTPPKKGFITIQIDCAKYDEDGYRALDPFRTVTVARPSDEVLGAIRTAIQYAKSFETEEAWLAELKALQRVLRKACVKLWPGQKKRRYGLYSARHQFAATAKLHWDGHLQGKAIVAALMGHATDETATRHYARKARGKIGRPKPHADPKAIVKVRCVASEPPNRQIRGISERNIVDSAVVAPSGSTNARSSF